jgi:hypothetical protein
VPVHLVSAVTGEGLPELLDAVARVIYAEATPRRAGRGRKLDKPRATK